MGILVIKRIYCFEYPLNSGISVIYGYIIFKNKFYKNLLFIFKVYI